MKKIKNLYILPLALLTACAPHHASTNSGVVPNNLDNQSNQVNQNNQALTTSQSGTEATATTAETSAVAGQKGRDASAIASWSLSGAMAARGNKKSWSASLSWQQQGMNNYHIRLSGPLGSGTVLIDKSGGVVTYKDGPKSASSRSADELLQKQTGIRLPVSSLYYWVRGLPAPGAIQGQNRDAGNRLISLNQGGYTINYGGYSTVGNVNLPNKIQLNGHGVSIKLVIKSWNV